MAGGRRNFGKSNPHNNNSAKIAATTAAHIDENRSVGTQDNQSSLLLHMPKHVTIPDIPCDSCFHFEVLSLLFGTIALASQYLNLYRTVWWLPHSHIEYALNFYLINPHVVAFSLIMIGRRLPLVILRKVALWCLPTMLHATAARFLRVFVIGSVLIGLLWCSYNIFLLHKTLTIFCLGYPAVVYIILFGFNIIHLFELNAASDWEMGGSGKGKVAQGRTGAAVPGHSCSLSAELVREEVEQLKLNFNCRLKQTLFNSLLVAYYTAFVPCCFAQSALYYSLTWVALHICFVWLSTFTMYAVFCFPPRYCDMLHRAALHLGRWQKVEARNIHVPYQTWSETTSWQQGALIKYTKDLYRAEGIANAAEPGNATHSRFYAVFSNLMGILNALLGLQVILVATQMTVLIRSSEWNHVLSVALLLTLNCLTLFRIARQYLVLGKIYHVEQLLQERLGS